jgi:hypothetical protein
VNLKKTMAAFPELVMFLMSKLIISEFCFMLMFILNTVIAECLSGKVLIFTATEVPF